MPLKLQLYSLDPPKLQWTPAMTQRQHDNVFKHNKSLTETSFKPLLQYKHPLCCVLTVFKTIPAVIKSQRYAASLWMYEGGSAEVGSFENVERFRKLKINTVFFLMRCLFVRDDVLFGLLSQSSASLEVWVRKGESKPQIKVLSEV